MTFGPIGKFQTLGTLGNGAHSTILHIRRSADSKQYALKVVPIASKEENKFLDQARHEFQVAQMLDHPNLIKIHVLETESDWLFRIRKVHLLIEYVNGKTLDTVGKLSLAHMAQVFLAVATGMVHVHKRGVCHADLKPNNIMLSRNGEVKIIDYGLAWIKGQYKGRIQGTPEYMAPETAQRGLVNERSDIYNFGATMYRLLTGRKAPQVIPEAGGLPLDGAVYSNLLKPVQELNKHVPAELAELVHRCLAFKPEGRPVRMSEIQGPLDHLAEKMVRKPEDRLGNLEW